jgi:hypothetical protein
MDTVISLGASGWFAVSCSSGVLKIKFNLQQVCSGVTLNGVIPFKVCFCPFSDRRWRWSREKETKRKGKKDENENNLHAINGALFSVKYSLRYFTGSVIEL